MTEAARQALRRLGAVLADNSDSLKSSIANLNTFTGALARNSDRVDTILAGLERMTAGSPPKPTPALYDLTAPQTFPASDKPAQAQIVVPEPTAVLAFDTPRIIVAPGAGESPPVDAAQWRDNIPKLLQAKLIQSFENSNYVAAVARPTEGLNADYQLLIDIRNFQISPARNDPAASDSAAEAHVEFAAKVLGENGRIVGSRTFDAIVPQRDSSAAGAARAIGEAFAKATTDLVVWTRSVI